MKKLLLILALILTTILRISQTDGAYIGLGLGLGSVVGIWFLARSFEFGQKFSLFPEISALFLAISPWHIFISRYQDKALILLILILGVYLILKIFKRSPAIVAIFLIIFIFLVNPNGILTGFSNTQAPVWLTDEQRREHGKLFNHPLVISEHNKIINYSLSFLDLLSQHFQGDFLFISGDVRENGAFGQMYPIDFIFITMALIFMIKNPKGWGIILILLILTPIPSALDFQPPNALRAYLMIAPLTILSAFGASYIFKKFIKK